jgi:6-phosphogluconolactonase/glucosamine-6-phosphate isomerase/deaminase
MPISEDCPGSILRQTPHARLFLDRDSAAKVYP